MTNHRGIFLCQRCHEQREANNVRPLHALDSRFCNSNYSPSETEIGELKAALVEEENDLARYRNEIVVLRQKLMMLESEEKMLEGNVGIYHSAVSAQRRVPVEIWEAIFAVVCTSEDSYSLDVEYEYAWDEDDTRHETSIIRASAITLSHVCSRWKNIVSACARLWSSIRIQFTAPANITNLLQEYLDRSQAYPMSLELSVGTPYEEYNFRNPLPEDKLETWRLLVPHLQRCRALVLRVADMDIFPTPAGSLTFPNLVSFRNLDPQFRDRGRPEGPLAYPAQPAWFWNTIYRAPQLVDAAMETLMPRDALAYHRLTSLAVKFVQMDTVSVLFDLLPMCTALTSLNLGRAPIPVGGPSALFSDDPIEVPSLRHLDLGGQVMIDHPDHSLFSPFCRKLKLPSLASFSIRCGGWFTSLSTLLRCSTATLERARIGLHSHWEHEASLDHILPALQSLPRLAHLALEISVGRPGDIESCVTDFLTALLARLEPEEGRITFLPRLQSIHLTFSNVMVTTEVHERMLAVVSSRLDAETPRSLTEFCFVQCTPYGIADSEAKLVLDEAVLEKIINLGYKGIRVVFATEPW